MKTAFLLFCCLLLSPIAFAREVRVKTTVGGDSGIKDQVASKINRYFREFKDVIVTDTDTDLEVDVLVLEVKVRVGGGEALVSYAITVAISETLTSAENRALLKAYPNAPASVREFFNKRSLFADLKLYLVPVDNLDTKCRSIAEILDNQYIEPIRKGIEQARRRNRKETP